MSIRSPLDLLVTHAALSQMVDSNIVQSVTDRMLDSPEAPIQIKNVCAKVSVELSNEIDSICDFLGISKRQFLEAAFIEAVERANAIIAAEGVYEHMAKREGILQTTERTKS